MLGCIRTEGLALSAVRDSISRSVLIGALLVLPTLLVAQRGTVAKRPTNRAPAVSGGAWSMPDPSDLIEHVLTRIVTQDKPGAVPILQYDRRAVGRLETIEAVRKYLGRTVELSPRAFAAVEGWVDARKLELPPCEGKGCPAPVNSIWLAVTRIERGDLSHELNVWYTTTFAANAGTPQSASYAFCERWLRVGGVWKYDGFIRVVSTPS